MLSIVWACMKQSVFGVGNASQRVLRFLIPPSFIETKSYVYDLLETHSETSDQVTLAMKRLNSVSAFPLLVTSESVWPNDTKRIRVQSHIKSTLADAVNLLKATGQVISTEDEKHLSLLLTHPCGWSATYSEQMDEPWVRFFREQYPQLRNLTPILDTMTYPEELIDLPDGYVSSGPDFFLLATSDSFFFYDVTDGEQVLCSAGTTLEDVYNGMKDRRWADSSEDPWDVVNELGYLDPNIYFPYYDRLENGNFGMLLLMRDDYIKEYPGRKRNALFNNIFRKFKY